MSTIRTVAAIIVACLTVSCGVKSGPQPNTPAASRPVDDRQVLQSMIHHHREAVDMASKCLEKAQRPELVEFCKHAVRQVDGHTPDRSDYSELVGEPGGDLRPATPFSAISSADVAVLDVFDIALFFLVGRSPGSDQVVVVGLRITIRCGSGRGRKANALVPKDDTAAGAAAVAARTVRMQLHLNPVARPALKSCQDKPVEMKIRVTEVLASERWFTVTRTCHRSPGNNPSMGWTPNPVALGGCVAVVAGATRGAGRGIAAALGEAGATVVCTGRTTRSARSEYNRAETIEETAEIVTHLGGTGIAVAVDHLEPGQVKNLGERIRKDHGHIDVLVNDIWGGELLKGGPSEWNKPIWEHNLDDGLRILRLAIDTHLITSHYLLPLAVQKPGALLVEMTDGTAEYNASHYRISVFYDLAKVAVNRLAFSQGHELESFGATAVVITPGWLRSEMMLDNFGVSEKNWRDALQPTPNNTRPAAPPDFALSESPRYAGRAVVALATDPERARWNKKSVSSGQLAWEYGFTDIDGSKPDIWRFIEEIRERGLDASYNDYR